MPKKIKFESFVYRLLAEAEQVGRVLPVTSVKGWESFIRSLAFTHVDGSVHIAWTSPSSGHGSWALDEPEFYVRGDADRYVQRQHERGLIGPADNVQLRNQQFFRRVLQELTKQAGLTMDNSDNTDRLAAEEQFHDAWAGAADLSAIDVIKSNEVCTAPEMRYIRKRLGDLKGRNVLDVGCGLGEASVYFAMQGARVTSMDLSQGMLDATQKLAKANGVTVTTHKAAAEETRLPANSLFDVIYAGNLLHHVDIARTLDLLKPHLLPGGLMITWDPIAYNPIINVYRCNAMAVRTTDEHPFRKADIDLFRQRFAHVETRHFWLTTLMIFLVMALVQRRDPNKERYWKTVVHEGDRWRPLYAPLALIDLVLLTLVPPLRWLCWNVVVIARTEAR